MANFIAIVEESEVAKTVLGQRPNLTRFARAALPESRRFADLHAVQLIHQSIGVDQGADGFRQLHDLAEKRAGEPGGAIQEEVGGKRK